MARESVRIEGLAEAMQVFRQLPAEVIGKAGGPVKFGLRSAAELLRDEAKRNVRKIIDTPNAGGDDKSTGLLLLSITAGRGKMRAGVNGETYSVRIRRNQKYPESRGKDLTAAQVGRLLEYGSERRDAMPWLRPAFDAKKSEALRVFVAEFGKRTQAAVRKLEREARVKK